MGKTAIRPGIKSTAITALAPPAPAPRPQVYVLLKEMLAPLASLRLTVVLFSLSLVLIFLGTLAQVDQGIFTVLHRYFRTGIAWIPWQVFVRFGQVFFGVPQSVEISGSFPYPGGWLLGGLLLVNLLAAHAVRFKMSWKRAGILLIHSGLVIMMLGELVTGLFAVEGKMAIMVGHSSNYTEETEATELTVIDPSNPKTDDVVAVPERLLRTPEMIGHELLPFDVEVIRYMVNSTIPEEMPEGAENPANAGDGLKVLAVEQKPVSGVDTEGLGNVASAYVTLKEKGTGKPLGTYLVSQYFSLGRDMPQQVSLNGKTYNLYLRYKRTYKPYTIYLKDFRHDIYPGTEIPKNFSSEVRLTDPSQDVDHEAKIWMNNPLRYAGETFYQSGVLGRDEGTVLQVVRNPGWEMPYLSCVMVSLGMLVHFGIHLVGFLRLRIAK